jgi:hypothetical protein
MGTSKPGRWWQRSLSPSAAAEPDYVVDNRIRNALIEDALARPTAGTWERLRQAILDRKRKNYGMWVLDEPLRDPPESPPMMLSRNQYQRALQAYDIKHRYAGVREMPLYKDALWGGIVPTFAAFLNL